MDINTLSLFKKYFNVGIINTALHWLTFYIVYRLCGEQSISNLTGFLLSVSFSYFANAKYTFESRVKISKYILYVAFMGIMSYLFGYVSSLLHLHAIITLILFSGFSLIAGFVFSKIVVFKK